MRKLSIRAHLLILAGSTIMEIKQTVENNKSNIHRMMQNISFNKDVQNYLVDLTYLSKYQLRRCWQR